MNPTDLLMALENWSVSDWIRTYPYAQPLISAIHIFGATLVFGTISIVDLRLLGIPSTRRSFTLVARELLHWTWIAFALALITGVLMFATNGDSYIANRQFQLKMLFLLLAGLNMLIFELYTVKNAHLWDIDTPVPWQGKLAGILSLGFWAAVIFLGRWIGYTQRYDAGMATDMDFDSLLLDFL